MSLGQSNEFSGKLYILKPRTQTRAKEKVDPYFEVLEKNENGKWVEAKSENQVSGDLVKVEHRQSEWEGKKFDNVNLTLRDDQTNESFLIEMKTTMLNRGILNSLFNLTDFSDVKISLYTGKSGYPAAAVRQHGELVKWKYNLEDLPKPTVVTLRGEKVNDYYEVDQFFIEKSKDLAARLNAGSTEQTKSALAPKKDKKVAKAEKQELQEILAEDSPANEEDLF